VHGFISDGAQTNRKVWNEYGLGGKLNSCQNYVEHFVDPERKFFAFSDTPRHVRRRTRFRATVVSTKSPKLHLGCQSSRGGLPPPQPPSVPGRSPPQAVPQVGCLFQAVEPDAS
ncbi:Reverse transcriptase domain-containing protein, partial [Aphis craccivora]